MAKNLNLASKSMVFFNSPSFKGYESDKATPMILCFLDICLGKQCRPSVAGPEGVV